MPTVTAVSPNSGPVGGGTGPAPITRESTAFPVNSETAGNSSTTISPVKVGDLVVLSIQLHSTAVSVSGITGGNVGTWKRAISYSNTTTDTLDYEVWWGVATGTGASTATVAYSGPASSYPIELVADSFTTSTPLTWSVVTTGGTSNPSSTSVEFPSLTSGTAADQLYWGVSEEESSGTSTATPGFTADETANANCFLYDGGLAPSTAYAPTCGEYPANVSTAAGVIFAAGGSGGSGGTGTTVTITGTNFAAGDTVHFGSSAATSVTVSSSTSIKAVAPPGNPAVIGGTVDVTVTGPGGTSATSPADEFTYLVTSPTYSISLSASTTAPAVGSAVTLTATANRTIGPTPYGMSIVDASTGTIVAHAGSGAMFSTSVSQSTAISQRYVAEVDNAGGTNIQADSVPVVVTWSGTAPPAPTVSGLSPTSGPAAGGTTVTVTGTNFAAGDTVQFGSAAGTSVHVASATSLSAVAPAGAGTVDVIATGPGGTSATSSTDRYTYDAPGTGGSTPTYNEASGFPVYARGGGLASISMTPKAIGDLVVLMVELHSGNSPTVTGLTSSNVTWKTAASAVSDDPAVPLHLEIWSGVATSTAATTTTISYSSSVSSNTIELIGDSFHYTGSGTWSLVKGGGTNGSSSTVAFPSLTSAASSAGGGGGGGIYFGYSRVASSYSGGSTSGFSYYGTPMGNVELRNVSLAPSSAVAPTASQSANGEYSSIGAVFAVAGSTPPPPATPTVTGLSPTSGPAAGGSAVTVTGTNFATGDTVDFGSVAATSVTVASATSLSAVAPAGTGTVDVRVTGPGGTSATSSADRFAYVATPPPAPTVTALSPASGPAVGGTKVTVTGTNFATGDTVDFGASPATTVTVTSPASLSAVSPAGTGTVDVTVTGPGGTSPSGSGDRFAYVATPPAAATVTGLSPSSGPAAGGTTVTASGTSFASGDTVAFGPNAATSVTVTSPTSLSAVAPAGTGTVDVRVTGPGGTSATGSADQFTYVAPTTGPAPTYAEAAGFPVYGRGGGVSTVSLTPQAVGDLVVLVVELHSGSSPTVTGLSSSNVAWKSSASAVDNDSAVPLHLEIWSGVATSTAAATTTISYSSSVSSNTIELIGESFHYTGSGTWSLVKGGGTNGSSSTVAFPSLTSAASSAGGGGGGIYFGYSRVATSYAGGSTNGFSYYGTPMANVEIRSVTLAPSTAYAPTALQSGNTEFSSIGAIFAVTGSTPPPPPATPAVTGVSPTSGPASGGTLVTVSGTNFAAGDTVAFGSAAGTSVTVTSATSLTAVAPAGAGTVDVKVTGAGGTSATTSGDRFTYVATAPPAPTVSGLTPTSGPASGGTTVTVTGTNFAAGDTVAFGSAAGTSVTVTSATSLTAVAPTGIGTVDVRVTGPGGTSATGSADRFTYVATPPAAPTVSGLNPTSGPTSGGTTVTVTGTNFAVGDTVSFGAAAGTSVSVTSAASLTAVAPAGTGTVDVTVTGPGGTSATGSADRFTYTAPTTGPAPTYAEAAGFPVYGRAAGASTVSLTPQAVGDLVVLVIELHSGSSPTVTGLSSSNVAWQSSASAVDNDPAVPLHTEIWAGVATSTATATTTISYSGSVSSNTIELIGDSFQYTGSGTWSLVKGGGVNGSSSTVAFPSLTSAAGSAGGGGGGGGIYVGYSRVATSYAGGSTSGFSYYGTPMANVELRSVTLAPSTTYAPTALQSGNTEFSSIGAIFAVQ